MFFPQYSIRTILLVMGLLGVVSAFGSLAVRGQSWAVGLLVGVAAVAVFFLLSAGVYLLASRLKVHVPPALTPRERSGSPSESRPT